MSNPFSKLPNPSSDPDPRTITISDFQKYRSFEMEKLNSSCRSFKKSLPFMAGVAVLTLFGLCLAQRKANLSLFNKDRRGGNYLDMKSMYDEDHYAYNREFQRMFVLGEARQADPSQHSRQLIKDLGITIPQYGHSNIPKRPPHEKFF